MEKQANNYLVVKSNTLIRQRTSLSLSQLKIVLFLIQAIDKKDNEKGEFKNSYVLDIKDFLSLEDSKYKDQLKRVKQITMELRNKGFTIVDGDTTLQTGWISSVKYKENSTLVEFSFDPKLKPYLLNLKKNFTAYDIRCLLRLKSGYSIIMYELIRSYKNQGSFIIYIEELKNILGVKDKYKFLKDFKKYALDKAKEELTKYCDLTFDYQPFEKQGKKILSLEIGVYPTKQETPKEVAQIEEKQQNYSIATTTLIRFGIPTKKALELYEQKGEEFLTAILNKWAKYFESGKMPDGSTIKSTKATLLWAIENEDKETEFEKEKRKQEEQERQAMIQRQEERQKRELEELKEKARQEEQARQEYANTAKEEMTTLILEQLQQENKNYKKLSQENKEQLKQIIFENKERFNTQLRLHTEAVVFCLRLHNQAEQERKREKQDEVNKRGIANIKDIIQESFLLENKNNEKKKK